MRKAKETINNINELKTEIEKHENQLFGIKLYTEGIRSVNSLLKVPNNSTFRASISKSKN